MTNPNPEDLIKSAQMREQRLQSMTAGERKIVKELEIQQQATVNAIGEILKEDRAEMVEVLSKIARTTREIIELEEQSVPLLKGVVDVVMSVVHGPGKPTRKESRD